MALDIYRAGQWHDFFVMVGGGAAVLAGLVFVALSLNLDVIARDATHRYRAVGTLAGFSATFVICSLALMGGQDHRAVGSEWLLVAIVSAAIYFNGYIQAIRKCGSTEALSLHRFAGGGAIYIAQVAGAALFALGHLAGIYVAAVSMTALLAFGISGAWLLIVGVQRDTADGGPSEQCERPHVSLRGRAH